MTDVVTNGVANAAIPGGLDGPHGRARSGDGTKKPRQCGVSGVPRPGIEPGTRGFSIPRKKERIACKDRWLKRLK